MDTVLITAGIGDFIAVESHMTVREINAVRNIIWATPAHASLMQLVPFMFPNLRTHIVLECDWQAKDEATCIESKLQLSQELNKGRFHIKYPRGDEQPDGVDFLEVVDLSIGPIMQEVDEGTRQYHGSSLVRRQLCDVSRFQLPEHFILMQTHSDNCPAEFRDLDRGELNYFVNEISKRELPAVIVGTGTSPVEEHPLVLDLTNRTTLLEAIEISKLCCAYYGAASAFSVIASKVVSEHHFVAKCHRFLREYARKFYYAPLTSRRIVQASVLSTPVFPTIDTGGSAEFDAQQILSALLDGEEAERDAELEEEARASE